MADLKNSILAALPFVARISGGVAKVTDFEGVCLRATDESGEDRRELEGRACANCRSAARGAEPRTWVDPASDTEQIAIPMGGYVLSTSNAGHMGYERRLFEALKETLPLIARVVGGEAVLFDVEGRRTHTADPVSGRIQDGGGDVMRLAGEVMRSGKPEIGPSTALPGAMAVRIPICPSFGFGFNNVLSIRARQQLIDRVNRGHTAKYTWDDILGSAPPIIATVELAKRAATTSSSIMILGESGTGKELFAQAIHNASTRSEKPFIAINCSAMPENLVESTLFGYVSGAFTGAQPGGRAGLFEQASQGTLLLDEISEMPLESQAKLLRVLQEREIYRIGSSRPVPVDVRVICTSNQDLWRWAEEGRFRSDLYFRLNVIDIRLPPLRERIDDIPVLCRSILEQLFQRGSRFVSAIHPAAMAGLMAYHWPGNIRELHNVIERALGLASDDVLEPHHFPAQIGGQYADPDTSGATAKRGTTLSDRVREAETAILLETLKRHDGNRVNTARELGISVTTLWRRLKKITQETTRETTS